MTLEIDLEPCTTPPAEPTPPAEDEDGPDTTVIVTKTDVERKTITLTRSSSETSIDSSPTVSFVFLTPQPVAELPTPSSEQPEPGETLSFLKPRPKNRKPTGPAPERTETPKPEPVAPSTPSAPAPAPSTTPDSTVSPTVKKNIDTAIERNKGFSTSKEGDDCTADTLLVCEGVLGKALLGCDPGTGKLTAFHKCFDGENCYALPKELTLGTQTACVTPQDAAGRFKMSEEELNKAITGK